MDQSTEKALIESAKINPEAFGRIFDFYYPKIFSYALKRTGQVDIAQDITSEVFLHALDKLWQFEWKKDARFSSWLYRIATNEIVSFFRKQRKIPFSLQSLMDEDGFDVADKRSLFDEIITAQQHLEFLTDYATAAKLLQKLPFKYQEVITLKYFEHKTNKEISEILEKREGTIKSLLSRGLKKLQYLLVDSKNEHLEEQDTI